MKIFSLKNFFFFKFIVLPPSQHYKWTASYTELCYSTWPLKALHTTCLYYISIINSSAPWPPSTQIPYSCWCISPDSLTALLWTSSSSPPPPYTDGGRKMTLDWNQTDLCVFPPSEGGQVGGGRFLDEFLFYFVNEMNPLRWRKWN